MDNSNDKSSVDDDRLIMMQLAEAIDYFRLVPRIILICYSYLLYKTINWFMLLENPTTQQSGLIVTVVGIAGVVIGLYQSSGKDWTKPFEKWDKD